MEQMDKPARALVPEHSLPLMQAMSGAKPLLIGPYQFFYRDNWLLAIGYPLSDQYDNAAFTQAIAKAARETGANDIYSISPAAPAGSEILETDRYYLLSATAPVPGRLAGPLRKAAAALQVGESKTFTPGHRKLWTEFLQNKARHMNGRVAELYARAPAALPASGLRLLDARDAQGNIAASLLLDFGPQDFVSYILGAHSRSCYTPHAADLLFAKMLELAREHGKRYIQLGLGVNEGILRFKLKWGAVPGRPFVMARQTARQGNLTSTLAAIFLAPQGQSARQILQNEPTERPFAMLWQGEKAGRTSWLAGTAHFFRHSFAGSFRSLFEQVDNVIFEGPLDAEFMNEVEAAGTRQPPGFTPLLAQMSDTEVKALDRVVNGPGGRLARLIGASSSPQVDTRWLLERGMPWFAMFKLWTAFLERQGWRQSVDMEAWRIAKAMRKNVIGMETLEEQLESLCSLPVWRALNFFRACKTWKKRARFNEAAYLAGDLEKMIGSSAEFPTRTEHIIGRRDQRFRERMRPWLEQGGAAIFVGSAHLVNLRHMLAWDGFSMRQAPFGIWPKLHLAMRNRFRPDDRVNW